jgi:hypothetical protein
MEDIIKNDWDSDILDTPDEQISDEDINLLLKQANGITHWVPGRNDPCWCGSGKKFKKCCLPEYEKLQNEKYGEKMIRKSNDKDVVKKVMPFYMMGLAALEDIERRKNEK